MQSIYIAKKKKELKGKALYEIEDDWQVGDCPDP